MNNRQYKTKELLKRFVPYFKPYRKTLFSDLFCAALTTVCELVLPLIMRYITNEGLYRLASLSVRTIGSLGLLYLGLRIVDALASYYMADMGHVMGAKIETDMRRDAYSHLQKLSNTYYNNTKVGQIMGRITNDLFDVTEFAHHCPEEFFIAGIKIFISFIILAGIHLPLTLIIFLVVPVMIGVCMSLNFKMRGAFSKQRNQIGELNARIEDSLLGQKVVKAFTNEDEEKRKFERDNGQFLDIKKETYRYMAAFQTTTKIFDGIMYLAVLVAGGIFMIKGMIMPGDLVAYMLYVTTMIATIRRIIEFAEQFQRGMTGIERFLQIMDADIEIFDDPDAIEMKGTQGNIVFENVSFEYPDDHNIVFTGLNLSIRHGEKVAIVGPSGGGKTTLCNLIPRFYDVTEGRILIDGEDIRHFTLKSLRTNVGIVQQDVYLFSGTIYENIIYGRGDALKEEVVEAAKAAHAHSFVKRLPQGYDTKIGEELGGLSQGQKQLLCIARVMLSLPPMLILDEATSSIDTRTEVRIQKAFAKMMKGRTSFIVAHRLSTIRDADVILVMRDGHIIEQGSHEELLAKNGFYAELYNSQFSTV